MVTAVLMPEGIDGQQVYTTLRDRHGVVLAGGQGPLRGRIVRIGHMGYMNRFDILIALSALELALASTGTGRRRLAPASPGRPSCSRRSSRPGAGRQEQIADAGVELLRSRFDVDLGLEMGPRELPADRRVRRADRARRPRSPTSCCRTPRG